MCRNVLQISKEELRLSELYQIAVKNEDFTYVLVFDGGTWKRRC